MPAPPKMPETALLTPEEQQRLLEAQRLKTERKQLRMVERDAHLKVVVSQVMADAAGHVLLKRHMFKTEDELDAVLPPLTKQQRKIIRQWEEPKKATAFGVESSAKLIEAKTRAEGEKKGVRINVENMNVIQLPPKQAETLAPVVIEVEVDK